jgi:hypothetical protein
LSKLKYAGDLVHVGTNRSREAVLVAAASFEPTLGSAFVPAPQLRTGVKLTRVYFILIYFLQLHFATQALDLWRFTHQQLHHRLCVFDLQMPGELLVTMSVRKPKKAKTEVMPTVRELDLYLIVSI